MDFDKIFWRSGAWRKDPLDFDGNQDHNRDLVPDHDRDSDHDLDSDAEIKVSADLCDLF